MRLEPREVWEFTAGDAVGSLVPLGMGAAAAAAMLWAEAANNPAVMFGGFAVGCVVAAYLGLDWVGRASRLVDEHRDREAETNATTPAVVALRCERDLVLSRADLVREIAALNPDALEYARRMIDDAAVIADGTRAMWRVGGLEVSVHAANDWLEAMARRGGNIPADADHTGDMYVSREVWRQIASAMAESLRSAGVAEYSSSKFGPRWVGKNLQLRQQALSATGVYLAAGIADGLSSDGPEVEQA